MLKKYRRYGQLNNDILKLLYRSKLSDDVKNRIIFKLSFGNIKFKIFNKRYEEEYFNFLPEPTKVLVFEACAKNNLRKLLNKKFTKKEEKHFKILINILQKKA